MLLACFCCGVTLSDLLLECGDCDRAVGCEVDVFQLLTYTDLILSTDIFSVFLLRKIVKYLSVSCTCSIFEVNCDVYSSLNSLGEYLFVAECNEYN